MSVTAFNESLKETLDERLIALERHFQADVIFYYGQMNPGFVKVLRDFIEKLAADENKKSTLTIILNTPGGSAEAVEKFVEIIRFHYEQVYFVVPDYAMSAGTIFCMAGDKIFMDYSSSLGPIDPQVFNGKEWVPALGYLDQVDKLLDKSRNNTITGAEFAILQNLDLATLSRYEQARNLTVTLLKKWLVEFKFKDWKTHNTNPNKKGTAVADSEKTERAEEIARQLGNNQVWHSHGRMIGIRTLTTTLHLQIEDYSNDGKLRNLIRSYNDLMLEFVVKSGYPLFMHSRNHF